MATIDSASIASLAHGLDLHETIAAHRAISVLREPGPRQWRVCAFGPEAALLTLAPDMTIVRTDRGTGAVAKSGILDSPAATTALVERVRTALAPSLAADAAFDSAMAQAALEHNLRGGKS